MSTNKLEFGKEEVVVFYYASDKDSVTFELKLRELFAAIGFTNTSCHTFMAEGVRELTFKPEKGDMNEK